MKLKFSDPDKSNCAGPDPDESLSDLERMEYQTKELNNKKINKKIPILVTTEVCMTFNKKRIQGRAGQQQS